MDNHKNKHYKIQHAKKSTACKFTACKSTVKNNSPKLGRKNYHPINFKELCDKLNIHLITNGIDTL